VVFEGNGDTSARIAAVRQQIAFYGSTPAYRPVLELHGWGDLADRLHALSLRRDEQRWAEMGTLITDDVLDAFAVIGTPREAAAELKRRFGDLVDRATIMSSSGLPADQLGELIQVLR
jgi:alkanesulfonate monooxygenase SsuD/methylene tetrahydromethanopterin reductase-like flavin-dependent oxidoreductase (luciferase family)